jgi:DNA-binding transcriptional LysR family regulator
VNTTSALTAACAAGHGIALLPVFAGDGLVPILPRVAGPTRELWSVTHNGVRRMARVVAVTEWLARTFDT